MLSAKAKNKLHTYIVIDLPDKETSAIFVSRDSHSLQTFMTKTTISTNVKYANPNYNG